MVEGMDRFKEHFKGFESCFAVIGGAACDEWFSHEGLPFRATKDVDMVLLIEASQSDFIERFWEFIEAGNYSNKQKSSGDKTYYRFSEPELNGYPAMLELFSKKPIKLTLNKGQYIVPIPVDEDISSLSAILLDEDYYQLVLSGRDVVDGLPVVRPDILIPLKAKAWLDLSNRKKAGEFVTGYDVKKHRNDVFRLAHILPAQSSISISASVLNDLHDFLDAFPESSEHWEAILVSIKSQMGKPMPAKDLLKVLRAYYKKELPQERG